MSRVAEHLWGCIAQRLMDITGGKGKDSPCSDLYQFRQITVDLGESAAFSYILALYCFTISASPAINTGISYLCYFLGLANAVRSFVLHR